MQKINFINLFKTFFKIGIILLGGGYVIIPIMKNELVEKNKWLNDDELLDFYCTSQCLPGIIAVNMAILTGYKIYKFKGAIISIFAMSLSPFISIVILANFIEKIASVSFIQSLFWGVNISVIILIYLTLKEMWQKSINDFLTVFWFIFIFTLSVFKINPALLITFSILFGIIIHLFKDLRNKENV